MMYDVWFVKEDRFSLVLEGVTEEAAGAYVAEESVDCDPYDEGYEITAHGEMPAL